MHAEACGRMFLTLLQASADVDQNKGCLFHVSDVVLVDLIKASMLLQVEFDAQERLWVVGGPLPGTSDAVCIGVASCRGTGSGRKVSSISCTFIND